MDKIKEVKTRMVLDSRGLPTIKAEITSKKGFGSAIAPSGTSTGLLEAVELRDEGKAFKGMHVSKALDRVNSLVVPKLKGKDCQKQAEIDDLLIEIDSTSNKSKLGSNSTTALSTANAKCAASSKGMQVFEWIAKEFKTQKLLLPVPICLMIEGGRHAGNNLQFQEFHVLPLKADSYSQALQICVETYQTLKQIIADRLGRQATNVGLEGGFAPNVSKTEDAVKLIELALKETGFAKQAVIGIDCSANNLFKENNYHFEGKQFDNIKLVEFFEQLVEQHSIGFLEDPFFEEDLQGFCLLTKALEKKAIIAGDDLLVTRVEKIKRAAKLKACNAVVLKTNQVGTLSETLDSAETAFKNNFKTIVSHRSGESEDSFIADFAVGIGSEFIKTGAPARSERTCKYNRLLEIEELLGKKAVFAGKIDKVLKQ